jgi:hypothetical protein
METIALIAIVIARRIHTAVTVHEISHVKGDGFAVHERTPLAERRMDLAKTAIHIRHGGRPSLRGRD